VGSGFGKGGLDRLGRGGAFGFAGPLFGFALLSAANGTSSHFLAPQ
jgi:hypothetical protein